MAGTRNTKTKPSASSSSSKKLKREEDVESEKEANSPDPRRNTKTKLSASCSSKKLKREEDVDSEKEMTSPDPTRNTKTKPSASCSSKKLKREEVVESENEATLPDTKRNTKTKPSPFSSKKLKREGVVEPEKEATMPDPRFVGDPVPQDEARRRWPNRYQSNGKKQQTSSKGSDSKEDSDEIIPARCHYLQAEVDGHIIYNLYDDAHVKAEDGEDSYICRIVEMFEAVDGTPYFTAQWYYRAKDTVIKDAYPLEKKRVFFSEIKNDNPLDCLVEKLKIVRLSLNEDLEKKKKAIKSCNYYCDMQYLLPYSTFVNLPPDNKKANSGSLSTISTDSDVNMICSDDAEVCQISKNNKSNASLLDLYSGCGAMSTGLCLGANMSGLNLVTRWAVDLNKYACESLSFNHPETEVRNESAEDFLSLLKEWEKLCMSFSLVSSGERKLEPYPFDIEDSDEDEQDQNDEDEVDDEEIFELEKILKICYGDPKEKDEPGLYFKVKWKNYGPDYDSWEPIEGLSNCREAIKEFVMNGYKSRILPLPGDVDVICGGPPCQGISGFNRFRNTNNPLEDEKNKQLIVFMDIVNFLKPKFVLMENVVDILKFAGGFLGRYALGRLIEMNYQTRLGMMAAGAYGLPQFRMRAFLWGAQPNEKLPQYPLPTHDVIVRGVVPVEFEGHTVAYDEGSNVELEKKLLLEDAISDLPSIENNEHRDEMPYGKGPQTEFQRLIRLGKDEMLGSKKGGKLNTLLYDHRPLELNNDDYQRVCQIPKKKGANFRDLPGVRVRPDNKVEWDPEVKRVYLDSGKPLVPDYAMSFVNGSSSKPFARLWWDETVPTVVTRAEPHNQAITHPTQDRVLSIRENARLQGFPDYYKLFGPIKERYIQVGNAVAVPVARALGYSLGLAFQGSSSSDEPLFKLPEKFPNVFDSISSTSSDEGS